MAVMDTLRIASGPTSLAGRIQGFIANLMATVISWNDMRLARKALNALSDRELQDIGLSRGAIDDVVRR